MRSPGQKPSTTTQEKAAMIQHNGPMRTRAGRLNECFARWISNSALGESFGYWASKTIALPQLRRLVGAEIPWTTLQKPLSDSAVVLLSTGGVHLRSDRPFNLHSDATFRVIPKDAQPGDLAISHQAYDRTDALRDINLVFPILWGCPMSHLSSQPPEITAENLSQSPRSAGSAWAREKRFADVLGRWMA